jgi:4-amino-4-deoxy-L-arabinose transferase-like glycosyltransferase
MRSSAILGGIVALAVLLRIAAALILRHPIDIGDGLAYFTMAETLAGQGVIADNFGQHAFYSAGYPLFLTPLFAILGPSLEVVLSANMILAAASTWLVFALARTLARREEAGLLAALAYAAWLPAIWNATLVAKENLSTPLFLVLAICAVHIARNRRPVANGLAAGLAWGAAMVTGGSAVPLCAGVALAIVILWRCGRKLRPAICAAALFLAGTTAALSPWLHATDRMVGRPVLTTNGAFNLYLGNNPAATGRFVSIADTPLGRDWEATRVRLGEVRNADRLEREAIAWISGNPGAAARLAVLKLVYFWQPNTPDAADLADSGPAAAIRWFEVAQYLLIIALALWGFFGPAVAARDKWILATMIVGFWLLHAMAYVIVRYRDPAIPLLIAMASAQLTYWARERRVWGGLAHAA